MDLVVNTPVDDEVTTNTFTVRGVSRNMDLGGVKGWGLVPLPPLFVLSLPSPSRSLCFPPPPHPVPSPPLRSRPH